MAVAGVPGSQLGTQQRRYTLTAWVITSVWIIVDYEPMARQKSGWPDATEINKRLFTFIKAPDGCYYVRNGEVNGPPSGRCLVWIRMCHALQ